MKGVLIILFLITGFISFGQSDGNDSTRYVKPKGMYGSRPTRLWADSVLVIPTDTTFSKDGIARIGNVFYVGNGVYWTAVAGTGTIIVNSPAIDSITFTPATICSWKDGTPTCADLSLVHAGSSTNFDGTKILYYNLIGDLLGDSVNLPHSGIYQDGGLVIRDTLVGDFVFSTGRIDSTWISPDSVWNHTLYMSGAHDSVQLVAGDGEGGSFSGGSGVQSVTGTAVDNTDPLNPVINSTGGGGGSDGVGLLHIVAGTKLSQVNDSTIKLADSVWTNIYARLSEKQAALVSGTNIKTINGSSILGSGDLTVSGGGGGSGTVTSVAALTLGTSGTDLSSSVANSTTTPVITLNVPTASASNRGALSSTDWSTFNGKESALTFGLGLNRTSNTVIVDTASISVLSRQRAAATYALIGSGGGTDTSDVQGYGITITRGATYRNFKVDTATLFPAIRSTVSVDLYTDSTLRGAGTSGSPLGVDTSKIASKYKVFFDSAYLKGLINTNTTDIALKANTASPTFTGTVTVPSGSVLGTPTSITLTNATGLPLTTGVTGALPIANGGTNNGSLSVTAGTLYYGDGTKLIGLAPGTAQQHLTGGTTPSWKDTAVGGGGTAANPTASVGLSAVNGVASTYMRSDAAPALDQAITPTWTQPHTFSSTINKVTITAPATSATLTLANGSSLITSGAFATTLTSTATTNATLPAGTGTLPYLGSNNTWTGTQAFNGQVGANTSNTFFPHVNQGTNQTGLATVALPGGANTALRIAVGLGNVSNAITTSSNYVGFVVGSTLATASASAGTHPWFVNAFIKKPTFTAGASTVTNTATLFVDSASTLGTNNYGLYSAGLNKFVGGMQIAYASTATGITLGAYNHVLNVTATGQTITLPTAVGIQGATYTIKLTASGSGTVATTSSQTIDGSTTYSLSAQYKYVTIVSDNANWIIISQNDMKWFVLLVCLPTLFFGRKRASVISLNNSKKAA